MIKKILVANRGEIALRVMRTCREMGIKSVAVYSEADRNSKHVMFADEAYYIGKSPSNESYLVIAQIIEAARATHADAIHPGYGFLSEKAEFAERCEKEGIIFIGPSAYAMNTMGDKITARKTMLAAKVPVVPGTTEKLTDENEALKIIEEIGLPAIIKASAGGGGKGMRLVKQKNEIKEAIRATKSEALAAFGDDTIYIERYIESPHHIEFQIIADKHGNTIHLCERECSVQRRHQKVIEETPSVIVSPELRKKMGETAVLAAKAVNYENAGTIEFLVDDKGNYYFLEMNTRLQVEHPITEAVIGIDLVREQINVANGLPLTYTQEQISQRGHAIECRVYAEDPDKNFMPSPGTIRNISEPQGIGVRVDGYVYSGYEIPIYYDPMISKIIVWAETRSAAINRMKRVLEEYKISGIKTSIGFMKRIMETPDFVNGQYDTHFIEKNNDFLFDKNNFDTEIEDMAIISAFMEYLSGNMIEEFEEKDSKIELWKSYGRLLNSRRI
ncbi:MAG: acetyl-CoA carboxylase biotin carboxylase subunit [Bacteroidetes bacterium CG02_land_8_20_14_3_00_31_25]|nr:acetyl-CoA carboxylase biotin carboxylase subunit [Bacteroidota bacterium]PIV60754.1 MAG: acetyl-CoA carboxylase biotin carboxylase subunit [Bacteroidetes bacterium CG02_land_8_20_14_3_00_31_25]PIX34508.1 MAG: acetyl-CoA carboxylase biotin carboxylase subunit [Bacteroidetes bacterium CG_4_8_14_3_um_filter_31_14]